MNKISCPNCGSYAVTPTGKPDDDNLVEYHCEDCGEYFVDEVEEEILEDDTL